MMSRESADSTHAAANPRYAMHRLLGRILHQPRWGLERRMRRPWPHHPVRDRKTSALGRALSPSSPRPVLRVTALRQYRPFDTRPDWVKKTCAKREMLVDRHAPADRSRCDKRAFPSVRSHQSLPGPVRASRTDRRSDRSRP